MSDIEEIKVCRDEVQRGGFDWDLEDMARTYVKHVDALCNQVYQAAERERVVAQTYQAQQQSYRELEAVYSACVEDKQQAEAENAKLRETLKLLFDKIETNEDGWALFGQKAYAAFFTYEEVAALQLIVFETSQ